MTMTTRQLRTIRLEADRLARQSAIDPTDPDRLEGTPHAVSAPFPHRESPPPQPSPPSLSDRVRDLLKMSVFPKSKNKNIYRYKLHFQPVESHIQDKSFCVAIKGRIVDSPIHRVLRYPDFFDISMEHAYMYSYIAGWLEREWSRC